MLPFTERNPTKKEIEKLRLLLSTYQDGTGMLRKGRLPGWRDFERSFAYAYNGDPVENKGVYDVLFPSRKRKGIFHGISCKMRGLLSEVYSKGIVSFEVSNASGSFWDALKLEGLTTENNQSEDLSSRISDAKRAGQTVINTVLQWHDEVDVLSGGDIDNTKSVFVILEWSGKSLEYRLFVYPFHMPNPNDLIWRIQGRSLRGFASNRLVIEWYGLSGGQLKYYPLVTDAKWTSEVFKLEPLPSDLGIGILNKAKTYFPDKWGAIEK